MPEELDSIGSSCKNDQEDHNSQQNVFQSFKKKKNQKKTKQNKTKTNFGEKCRPKKRKKLSPPNADLD